MSAECLLLEEGFSVNHGRGTELGKNKLQMITTEKILI